VQKAIDSGLHCRGSTRLAKIRLREGNVVAARQLYDEAIGADPTTRLHTWDWPIFTR